MMEALRYQKKSNTSTAATRERTTSAWSVRKVKRPRPVPVAVGGAAKAQIIRRWRARLDYKYRAILLAGLMHIVRAFSGGESDSL
jgi:hypothetical protein